MMRFCVALGIVTMASACSGDPGSPDELAAVDTASSFELLRAGHHGYGDHDDHRAGSRAIRGAIRRGADRLAAVQADTIGDNAGNGVTDTDPDDGGWDFIIAPTATSHSAAASPTNLYGETALGAWAAVDSGISGNRALVVTLDAGLGMQRDPDVDSPPDFVFGVLLAELADNPGFATIARQHYDAKVAANGGATGLGTLIRDSRHVRNEDGLIAYDLGWLTISAAALDAAFPHAGYDADASTYAGIVVDDLTSATPRFDLNNPAEGSYVIGLAWSQVAAAWLDSRPLFRQLRGVLLDQQHGNGSWGTSQTEPADDLQSTALAVETIALTDRATQRSRRAVRDATRFLVRGQAASGGWPDATSHELPLIDAEILLALMLSGTEAGEDGLVAGTPLAATQRAAVSSRVPAAPLP